MKVSYTKLYSAETIVQITANGHSYVTTIQDNLYQASIQLALTSNS